jgi:carnitine 3-dehydrogenase
MLPSSSFTPKVALVGTGAIGRGWAALCAANGWETVLFDTDAHTADHALAESARRARALVALDRADAGLVDRGLDRMQLGRSLLHACGTADWIIESLPEDLALKQRVLENISQVAKPEAIISSSSSSLPVSDTAARCREPGRCILAHPLNPPELIPLVEVVPGRFTAPQTAEIIHDWLRELGRIPITLKREVPGNVVGRIAGAVWRECIDLVLTGVVDVDDLDRAVSLGPGLGWAAAGPHLTYHLGAGQGGVELFLEQLLQAFESWWGSLAQWTRLEPEQVRALVAQIAKAYGDRIGPLGEARDRRLAAILRALEESRRA